ncbi:MAG: hypothetical protein Q8K96_12910 [Rubrivivax sp.]|nr:hypothetical protein [Rubrivivax sp.]
MKYFSITNSHRLLHCFRSACLMAILFACQASHSQTLEETLHAIGEIYTKQADCSLDGILSKEFIFLHRYNKDEATLVFGNTSESRGKYSSGPLEFHIKFDLRRITSIRPLDKDGDLPKLSFECKTDDGCVFFSGWGNNSPRGFAHFCSREARTRVSNALRHLQSITPPLPPLKF